MTSCLQAATEIMEKEGSALVDRPPMIAAGELLSGGKQITLVGSGERFRRLRKVIYTHFQAKAVFTYKDIQFKEAKMLILDILDDPNNHQKYAHRCVLVYRVWVLHDTSVCCSGYSTSVILCVTYGESNSISINDPEFVGVKQIVEHFIEGMRSGAYLVDRFPWLKYVPGYGRHLRSYHESDLKFYRDHLSRVERAMVNFPSLMSEHNSVTRKTPSVV